MEKKRLIRVVARMMAAMMTKITAMPMAIYRRFWTKFMGWKNSSGAVRKGKMVTSSGEEIQNDAPGNH